MPPLPLHRLGLIAALLGTCATAMAEKCTTTDGDKTAPPGRVLASDDGTREASYALQALPAPTGKNTIRKTFHLDSLKNVRSARVKLYAVLTDFTTNSEFDFEHWEWIFFTLNGHDWVVRPMDLPLARNGAFWSNWSNARWGSVAVPDVRWLREGENELVIWCNNLGSKPNNKYLEIGIDTDATTANSAAKVKDEWSTKHLRGETAKPEKRHTYPLPASEGEELTGEYMIRLELLPVSPEVAKRQALVTDADLRQAIAEGASWLVGLAESTEKICPGKPFDAHHPTGWQLDLAGGEYESFQLVLWALTEELSDVAVEVELDVPGISADLFRVGYVRCNGEFWPDPLWPMEGTLDQVDKDTAQPIFVRFHATRDARPGTYDCTIRITPAGREPRELAGTVTVHPFNLPKASSLPLGISLDYQVPSHSRMIDDYRMTMLNVSDGAVGVPNMTIHEDGSVTADWDEWKQRVEAFFKQGKHRVLCLGWNTEPSWIARDLIRPMTIAGTDKTRKVNLDPRKGPAEETRFANLIRGYEKALAELGVVDRCCFYVEDEPHTRPEHAAQMAGYFKKYAPAIHRLVTCAKIHPSWIDRFDLFVVNGNAGLGQALQVIGPEDILWQYTCGDLGRPPSTIPHDAAKLRAWPWFVYRFPRVKGLLYWAVSWQSPIEPGKIKDIKNWGDGTWFYTLPDGQALPSLRAEAMRDGLEDYEYLLRLRDIDTPEAREVMKQAHQIVPDAFSYPTDTTSMHTLRRAITEIMDEAGLVLPEEIGSN